MKEIGGYLELELPANSRFINDNGILLASCRNALEIILCTLRPIELLWVPFYTCEVVLEPINKLGIKYKKYRINEKLEIENLFNIKKNEYLLYTNYFGIKDAYVNYLVSKMKNRLIVDNAQAFYHMPSSESSFAYSPRKFIGIPDGGIAFISNGKAFNVKEQDISYNRCSHLLKRLDLSASEGYNDFRSNAESLHNLPVKKMSNLTQRFMRSINYEEIKRKRKRNFEFLHNQLGGDNLLEIPNISSFECPMVYPYWQKKKNIKEFLISNKVYVPTYWPSVRHQCDISDIEYKLSDEVAFIPIDQRYNIKDMQYILNLLHKWKLQ